MYRIIALLVGVTALSACVATTPVPVTPTTPSASARNIAINAIREPLRDPESLQTRNITGYRTSLGDTIVCGEYNARNGFGGYAGFRPFYVRIRGGQVMSIHQDNDSGFGSADIGCVQAANGNIALPTTQVPGAS
jgi:hypothetical protein